MSQLLSSAVVAQKQPKTTRKWVGMAVFQKTLFIDTELWISYNFNVSRNVIFLLISPTPRPLKNAIASLASWMVYQSRHQIWAMGCNLQSCWKFRSKPVFQEVQWALEAEIQNEEALPFSLVHSNDHYAARLAFMATLCHALTLEPKRAPMLSPFYSQCVSQLPPLLECEVPFSLTIQIVSHL